MTLDPNARQVRQRVGVAPSPATTGTDWSIDAVDDYHFHALEQVAPFKVVVRPQHEDATRENSETLLVTAWSLSTRAGAAPVAEVVAGAPAQGSADVYESQRGDGGIPQSEIQVLTVAATGGTYTLTFGTTTASINWNDNAATIQARLEALAGIGAGNVTVTGAGPFTITFAGTLANAPQALITATASSLTAGGAGTVAVTEVTLGDATHNEVQLVTVTADTGTFTLSWGGNTTVPLSVGVTAETVASELGALASIGAANIAVTGAKGGPYTVTFQAALGLSARALITANATLATSGGTSAVQRVTIDGDAGTFRLSGDGGATWTAAQAVGATAATIQTALTGLAAIGANNCSVAYDAPSSIYTVTFTGTKAGKAVTLLTSDAASLTKTTAHITACTRGQDGSAPRTILVGDHVDVISSSQGSINAVATLITAGKVIFSQFAHEIQAGGSLQLDSVAVADPVSGPSVAAKGSGTGFYYPPWPTVSRYSFAYTWIDGGGHETALSPRTSVTLTDPDAVGFTSDLLITIPTAIPANATGFRIYAINSAATPTHLQASPTYVSSETVSPATATGYDAAGAAPPGANTFGSNNPAKILDATGTVIVAADLSHFSATNPVIEGTATPGTAKTFARSDHVHPATSGSTTYRKTTSKTIVNSTSPSDLFNAEITIGANVMGATGFVRAVAWGDYLQQQGSVQAGYKFQVKFGGTTVIDTGTASASAIVSSGTRWTWKAHIEIANLGATNSQTISLWLEFALANNAASTFTAATPTTGTGKVAAQGPGAAGNNAYIRYLIENTAAIDTTAACALTLTCTLPVAHASVDCSLHAALVQIL